MKNIVFNGSETKSRYEQVRIAFRSRLFRLNFSLPCVVILVCPITTEESAFNFHIIFLAGRGRLKMLRYPSWLYAIPLASVPRASHSFDRMAIM